MNPFDLKNHTNNLYDAYLQGARRPVIGITSNYGEQTAKLAEGYYKQVEQAGGTPVLLPPLPTSDTQHVAQEALLTMLDRIDGLLLTGGADVNPLFVGEEPAVRLGGINSERDLSELLLARLAFNRQLPILGICRGMQVLAMALDGKVAQDITDMASLKHSQDADRTTPTHLVTLEPGSVLAAVFCDSDDKAGKACLQLPVNSFHHQAVSEPGPRLRVVARAADGIVEGVESNEYKAVLGVQWHPECMGAAGSPLFKWLVDESRKYREVQQLHDRILTLDTHCDTPMFFDLYRTTSDGAAPVTFARRDDRILVDLTKMREGRLDATIMVAYLPQTGWDHSPRTPRQYADDIFDRIEDIVAGNTALVAIARTPQDLWDHKRRGLKSVMLGIENGIALEGKLENLTHFVQRGIVYMTLCHNGDNDICDSAKGSQTHGGVSAFGEKVIREMNRQGVMVDLSHAAESSFYDALDISSMPIVCSHSSARALCNHPRNLTDDQMRALARKGGVAQTTLYPGFLVSGGEASILDAVAHLEHAINVMGIDHVGLGTDFDGDGGVRGLANASELQLFTRQLLARRFSEQDIQQIWGGNFLRVMSQVQQGLR